MAENTALQNTRVVTFPGNSLRREREMKKMIFASSVGPTAEHIALARRAGYMLIRVDPEDAFRLSPEKVLEDDECNVIATGHPAFALRSLEWVDIIGVFEYKTYSNDGGTEYSAPVALHLYDFSDGPIKENVVSLTIEEIKD